MIAEESVAFETHAGRMVRVPVVPPKYPSEGADNAQKLTREEMLLLAIELAVEAEDPALGFRRLLILSSELGVVESEGWVDLAARGRCSSEGIAKLAKRTLQTFHARARALYEATRPNHAQRLDVRFAPISPVSGSSQ